MEQVPGCLIDSNQMNVNGNDRHIIAWITGQLYAMKFVTEQKNGGVQRWQLSLKTKHNLLECVVDAIRPVIFLHCVKNPTSETTYEL